MTNPARGGAGVAAVHVSRRFQGGAGRPHPEESKASRESPGRVILGPANGEGGIRTLEAGISPPNALAGRRLQPLGHFSGRRIVPPSPNGESPREAGFRQAEGEGFEPSTHLSARTRFPVALLRPLGHPSERGPS